MAQVYDSIMESRRQKTIYFQERPEEFCRQFLPEIRWQHGIALRSNLQMLVRLNAFSDCVFESKKYQIPQQTPDVLYYDYTALLGRLGKTPSNYHLTGSYKGPQHNLVATLKALESGYNIAVCFYEDGPFGAGSALKQRLPESYRFPGDSRAWRVFDGDASDLRAFDPGPTRAGNGRICGLRLKGSLKARSAAIDDGFAVLVE